MSRGGKRKGAGRPPRKTPWAAISLKVEPGLLSAWNAEKRKRCMSGPKLLAIALHYLPKP